MNVPRILSHAACCTRRRFLGASAAVAAGVSTFGLIKPEPAAASFLQHQPTPLPPNPLLGGLSLQIPPAGLGSDPATVYNFRGLLGRAVVQGNGVGNGVPLFYNVDMGFAKGTFLSTAGIVESGTFLFC